MGEILTADFGKLTTSNYCGVKMRIKELGLLLDVMNGLELVRRTRTVTPFPPVYFTIYQLSIFRNPHLSLYWNPVMEEV